MKPQEVGSCLKKIFEGKGLRQQEIAINTGINQSQISRILSSRFKKVSSKNVAKLCEYAKFKPYRVTQKLHPQHSNVLMTALRDAWRDGSPERERVIAEILERLSRLG